MRKFHSFYLFCNLRNTHNMYEKTFLILFKNECSVWKNYNWELQTNSDTQWKCCRVTLKADCGSCKHLFFNFPPLFSFFFLLYNLSSLFILRNEGYFYLLNKNKCYYYIVEIKFLVANGTLYSAPRQHRVCKGHTAKNVPFFMLSVAWFFRGIVL